MAWLRYSDTFKPTHPPRPKATALLFVLLAALALALSVHSLQSDWHHHRLHWHSLLDLTVAVYFAARLGAAARRAWQTVRRRTQAPPPRLSVSDKP